MQEERSIRDLVIVGGGTAGWMAAAALSKILRLDTPYGRCRIRVVESDEIGTVGVGEATIPMIQLFNQVLGIDEDEFLRATEGTFKLGIEFANWGRPGDRYMHGFGRIGQDLWTVPFDQYWQRVHQAGRAADLGAFSITRTAAYAGRFMRPDREMANSPLSEIAYAFHFDASLYARFLRRQAEARGVVRTEGRITEVQVDRERGHVQALVLADGQRIEGELFLDCSGFRGLLIEEALHTGYEDWSHWLPCDRALAVPCETTHPLLPYTRSTALEAGWQWRIPLQHRTGNGHVYCSRYLSDDQAAATLLANLDGKPLAEPRLLRFTTGRRRKAWNGNVVALGLAGGFMEPLESTSIHLVQTAIARLVDFFPDRGFKATDIDEFNRQSAWEFERIRDFIILHYHLNQRDGDFWRRCREIEVPDTLKRKMALYAGSGRLVRDANELFAEVAWLQVMHGQNLQAGGHHALADLLPDSEVEAYLASVQGTIAKCVDVMPTHEAFIERFCKAPRA